MEEAKSSSKFRRIITSAAHFSFTLLPAGEEENGKKFSYLLCFLLCPHVKTTFPRMSPASLGCIYFYSFSSVFGVLGARKDEERRVTSSLNRNRVEAHCMRKCTRRQGWHDQVNEAT